MIDPVPSPPELEPASSLGGAVGVGVELELGAPSVTVIVEPSAPVLKLRKVPPCPEVGVVEL